MIYMRQMFVSANGTPFDNADDAWKDNLKTFLGNACKDADIVDAFARHIIDDMGRFGEIVDGLRGKVLAAVEPVAPCILDEPGVAELRAAARENGYETPHVHDAFPG